MAQQVAIKVENNFRNGLITEATGMTFPENSVTDTDNCVFNLDGSVIRRLGVDFETSFSEKTIDRDDVAISTYLWKNVSGDGDISLFVAQIGGTIYFWETGGDSVSDGAITSNITLSTYLAAGAPDPGAVECQFSSGASHLMVTHPYCNPFFVAYNSATQVVTGTAVTIQIRDFEGDTSDSLAVDARPTSTYAALSVAHNYNLKNQGWTDANLTAWDTAQTTMPSNADVMWRFKNSSDVFDASSGTINKVFAAGNSPAPKGHFILTVWDKDRDTVSGLSGVTSESTGYQRPSTSTWFSGRVFYAGINFSGYNTEIYFSQVAESSADYGKCHQTNDPTAEYLFDLLADDGGVIKIPEAGTIYKLISIAGGILVFANNGIWTITGSTGLGFRADDYTVQKISSVSTISASSFVDVAGYPAWWNAEGIYIISPESGGSLKPKDLTRTTIRSFFESIPEASKATAKGFFHNVAGVIQWVYRDTEGATPTETYSFNRALNYDVLANSFYPWSFAEGSVAVNSIVVLEGSFGNYVTYDIVDDVPNNVVDDSANQVISFEFVAAITALDSKSFKYLVSYGNGAGSYNFTFGETNNASYMDWFAVDAIGLNFDSYLESAYNAEGSGLKKFQPMWLTIFMENTGQFNFRGLWDYSNTEDTNRWSTQALITNADTEYDSTMKRIKVRGHGRVLQFRVDSVAGQPFDLSGWSTFKTINQVP